MKQNTRFFTHTSVIWALFILGNAVITLPTANATEYTFLGYITAAVLGMGLNIIALPVAIRLFREDAGKNAKAVGKILLGSVYALIAVLAVFCAADTVKDFIKFIKEIILTDTPLFFIALILAVVVIFFATRRQEDILKFFLIAFWFVLAVIIFFFVATAFKFNLRNIFIFKLPEIKELILQAKPYILNPVIPSVLLPVYNTAVFGKTRFCAALTGYSLGIFLLGLCVVGAVLLFGATLSGELSYPYSATVSTVSIGRLFTRLDGFSYYIYFAGALAKITVCVFIAKTSLKKINNIFN